MSFCIDILPTGNRSGDAVVVALNPDSPDQFLMIVDGGFPRTGEALAEHVQREYDTEEVDLVVCTHPDADHASGLAPVLQRLDVGELWIHQPHRHFRSAGVLAEQQHVIQASVGQVNSLEDIAAERQIPIVEPFQGRSHADGRIVVLGPSVGLYREALGNFRENNQRQIDDRLQRIIAALVELVNTDPQLIDSSRADDINDGENTSSVVLLIQPSDGVSVLLTSDATQLALRSALTFGADELDFNPLSDLSIVQIPHHGAFRNVGPRLLNSMLGIPQAHQEEEIRLSFFSASESDEHHPSQIVTDNFLSRGCDVEGTLGDLVRIIGTGDGSFETHRF